MNYIQRYSILIYFKINHPLTTVLIALFLNFVMILSISAQERQKIGESELKAARKVNFKNRENSRADQGTKLRK